MKASEVQIGDELRNDKGELVYTVERVTMGVVDVLATVRYTDGGDGERMWDHKAEVPLIRPVVQA